MADIFTKIDQINEEAAYLRDHDQAKYNELTDMVNSIEQTLIGYIVLPYQEKLQQHKATMIFCSKLLTPHFSNTFVAQLQEAILTFLNRVLITINQKCGRNFNLFQLNPYRAAHQKLATIATEHCFSN